MSVLDDLDVSLAAGNSADVLAHTRKIAGGASPEIAATDREMLIFDIAEWLWERGDKTLALDAMALALDLASKREGSDPVQLARRLDLLAERLQEIGQYSLSADVWKRAIDLSEPVESKEGHAVTWRLSRYIWCLRMIRAPDAQIDEVQSRLARRPPMPGSTPLAPPQSAPAPDSDLKPIARKEGLGPAPTRSEAIRPPEEKRLERPRAAASPDFETTARAPLPEAALADAYHRVPVHFATHRPLADTFGNPYETFANRPSQRKDLHFGIAHVTVPRSRELGSLPRQGWLASQAFDPDPALYITIRTIEMQDRGGFFGKLRERIGASTRKEALVFIHGYNNTFTDALMRCAQLAVDLEIDGAPILYSWPSRGTILGYVADREQSRNTELHRDLQAFLLEVAETTGATHIHLVGHSMGAQMLISTLDRIQETAPKPLVRRFEQIVFASPDVAFDQFAAAVQRVQPLARRVTVYASKRDVPLTLAGYLAGGDRTGLDASLLASVQGVASIDTTKAAEDFYAHGTFASRAIDDLQSVLWLSLDPSRRKRLVRQPAGDGVYWIYDPEAKAGPFARACTFVRQRGGLAGALAYIAKRIDELKNGAAPAAEIEQHVAVQAELDQLKGVVT